MARGTDDGFGFDDFQADLELITGSHPHQVRREPGVTYRDEYSLEELMNISPLLYEQCLSGWSRSYYLHDKHMQAIIQYGYKDVPISSINDRLYKECVHEVQNRLSSLPRVRALDVLSELDSVTFKSSSAAGYDYIGAKGPKGGENHIRAMSRAKAIMWSIAETGETGMKHAIETAVPDVGYTRTQLADITEKTKVRHVWGRAFHYILLEGLTADPLIRAVQRADTFIHIGKDPTVSVPRLLSDTAEQCKWLYALDWKQFDATVSRFEIEAAFDIVLNLLDFPNRETKLMFELSKQLFIHKKIAAPDGKIYWAHKGIPSGSYFTSIIGSIINRVRIEYLWRTITGHGPIVCYTQGDDSLCGDNILIPPERFAMVANPIGWYFNQEKTEYSTIPELITFLGRSYAGGLNKRDLKRCLRLLIFPEYPVESGRISAYRAQSISDDVGGLGDVLNKLADRLRRKYGIASEEEVPDYFKRYIP
ncbi:putative RNA-dependent RNA polymerase [Citrullus lanatus cryptic virus]|nr:putative RNA-dependent RNA polymerase [Citrullus lanatus cryptic virus]